MICFSVRFLHRPLMSRDWATQKQVLTLAHDTPIGKTLFSPDGKHLACYIDESDKSATPGLVEVRDASSGKLVFRRESHSDFVTCIAYSPDGKFLASGSHDGTVIVRDARMGKDILKLGPHRNQKGRWGPITSIAFSPGAITSPAHPPGTAPSASGT
jgi:WD40 repeat protein